MHVKGVSSFDGPIRVQGPAVINDYLKMTPRPSPPESPANGDVYYDNSGIDHAFCIYINGSWQVIAGTGACD